MDEETLGHALVANFNPSLWVIATQIILLVHTILRTTNHFKQDNPDEKVKLLIIDGVYMLYTIYYVVFLAQQCKLKEANERVVRIWFKTVISVNEDDEG